MKITQSDKWVYYTSESYHGFDRHFGKWMFYFDNTVFAEQVCRIAVADGITVRAKHANLESGIGGFYANADDYQAHMRILRFMLANDLVRKTTSGKYFDISFKYEDVDGCDAEGRIKIKLSDFFDLSDGSPKPIYVQDKIC